MPGWWAVTAKTCQFNKLWHHRSPGTVSVGRTSSPRRYWIFGELPFKAMLFHISAIFPFTFLSFRWLSPLSICRDKLTSTWLFFVGLWQQSLLLRLHPLISFHVIPFLIPSTYTPHKAVVIKQYLPCEIKNSLVLIDSYIFVFLDSFGCKLPWPEWQNCHIYIQ